MYFNFQISWALAISFYIHESVAQQLPQVDLGYETHRAISYNSTTQIYNFTNIRYAQPPLGGTRFAAPVPPVGRNPVVQNGSIGAVCPHAAPAWSPVGAAFTAAYVTGQPFNFSAAVAALQASNTSAPAPDPRTSEDCLFLDVIVPKPVFDAGQRYHKRGCKRQGAAVLVWIHGGGYTMGEKGEYVDPTGLIEASTVDGSEGIIFVAMNYRLGAFGWLSGPTLQSNGTANAGLYDQRLAIEWIRQNIHLFGGDPERLTLLGESAGGGSIMHQITAYGGTVPVPFRQAIPQSPGFSPVPSNFAQEQIFREFLDILGVATIEEARGLPSSSLIAANAAQIGLRSRYGTYTYGPVVDGSFVPGLPGKLLLQGAFDKNVKVMAGHNSNEGVFFTDPRVTDDTALATLIRDRFAGVQDSVVDYIVNTLYPSRYDGSQPYRNGLDRTILILSELIFTCNTVYLAKAYGNNTYNYQFSVPPGTHGLDVPYTFYGGFPSDPTINTTVALALQEYLTSFAQNGVPRGEGFPNFPLYGSSSNELQLNVSGIGTMMDSTNNPRCAYWQKALYY
ncbi:hypothetical protein GJ744_005182 [Endocarpon pusillum]|uniref:Carboxylic ester hydrolase n=1 Tax=Endocarpon pusillum TaxID=364733 RepID=A0A8H7DYW0_9EURO|nr:hypothetical protein GJ744_005182 [Endocarpon pusillum]